MSNAHSVEGGPAPACPPSTTPHVSFRHLLAPAVMLLVLGAYSISSSIPSTILTLPFFDEVKPNAVSTMPQGWAFFSKSPRDPSIAPYRAEENSLTSLSMLPTTRVENLFGVSRNGRAQGVEVALISGGSVPADWTDCESPDLHECAELLREVEPKRVRNTVAAPSVCGGIILIQTTPVPWSFRQQTEVREKADKAVKLQVACDAE